MGGLLVTSTEKLKMVQRMNFRHHLGRHDQYLQLQFANKYHHGWLACVPRNKHKHVKTEWYYILFFSFAGFRLIIVFQWHTCQTVVVILKLTHIYILCHIPHFKIALEIQLIKTVFSFLFFHWVCIYIFIYKTEVFVFHTFEIDLVTQDVFS